MAQEERYNLRERSYSAWHRRYSLGRFVGIESAQTLAMIDLDASLYVEYDDGSKMPLALIETARDVGQPYKTATVTRNLAEMADIPAAVVLYTLGPDPNPADRQWQDILSFRVKRLWPEFDGSWFNLTPQQWAECLKRLRDKETDKLDFSVYGKVFA